MTPAHIQALHAYAETAELCALVLGALFIAQYTLYSPWWRDPIGRTVVAMDLAIFFAIVPLVVQTFFRVDLHAQVFLSWFDVSCVMCVPLILAWRMLVWHRITSKIAGEDRLLAVIRKIRTRNRAAGRTTRHEH